MLTRHPLLFIGGHLTHEFKPRIRRSGTGCGSFQSSQDSRLCMQEGRRQWEGSWGARDLEVVGRIHPAPRLGLGRAWRSSSFPSSELVTHPRAAQQGPAGLPGLTSLLITAEGKVAHTKTANREGVLGDSILAGMSQSRESEHLSDLIN